MTRPRLHRRARLTILVDAAGIDPRAEKKRVAHGEPTTARLERVR